MKPYEIYEHLTNVRPCYAPSYYYELNNIIIRISNHLPNDTNFINNEQVDNIFLVFNDEVNERDIENWIDSNSNINVIDYFIVDNIEDLDLLNKILNR